MRRLAETHPDKTVVFLDKTVCYCSTMNRIDLPHLVWALESLVGGTVVNRITVDPQTAAMRRPRSTRCSPCPDPGSQLTNVIPCVLASLPSGRMR